MPNDSYEIAKIEFQIAIVKELYKNSYINANNYAFIIKKLEEKHNKCIDYKGLIPVIVDIKV